jgi:DNA-binding response OmpR family regulator
MKARDIQRLRVLLHRARRGMIIGNAALSEAQEVADRLFPTDRVANLMGSQLREPASLFHRPLVDLLSMTVTWSGRTCLLRSRILLALMNSLARRPNHFVPFEKLRHDVWDGAQKSDDTIRSTVRHLKGRLIQAEMGDLARHICAAGQRYGLVTGAP